MARTRGAKSSSPSSRKKVPRGRPFQIPLLSLRGQKQFLLRLQLRGIWTVELGHSTPSCALTQPLPIAAGACTVIPPAAKIPHGAPADSKRLLLPQEKVHKKKLQRADAIPLLFPRLLCQILEHLGYPSEPQLERKRICREVFTLDKWNNMTAYRVEQPERPQPAARRASPRHIPEGIPIAAPAIPRAPPVTPASSEPSTSAEPRMAIPFLNTESYVVQC
ncbi:hypothetical protein CK203_065702 [Vitis vinifera]|uniref:Uncharacterized protein n=1 Tax=Vitis vinifera TaxID=29760 RepID=A0A438G2H1_VITVI|nr:hypothetical protein CK203_065702 [Vitis vinifera]